LVSSITKYQKKSIVYTYATPKNETIAILAVIIKNRQNISAILSIAILYPCTTSLKKTEWNFWRRSFSCWTAQSLNPLPPCLYNVELPWKDNRVYMAYQPHFTVQTILGSDCSNVAINHFILLIFH